MLIEKNTIINGTDDIAKYLELNPSKTIFLHSTSFDESDFENFSRKFINKGRMLYSEILSYSSSVKNGSKSAIGYFNDELLDTFDEYKILNRNNIIKLVNEKLIDYPYNSVSTMLNRQLKSDIALRNSLKGYTIVSSYLGKEDEENAKILGTNLLMDKTLQEKFNSKYEFRKMAEKSHFSVPLGVTITGLNNLSSQLLCLKEKSNTQLSKIWIKLESQSSGTGNIEIENFYTCGFEYIKNKIYDVSKKIYSDNYIFENMNFIAECDVESEYEKIVSNIGIEAVVSTNRITILGGVEQETHGGAYIGSKITPDTYKYLDIAENCAKNAFLAVQANGYRGFMTIDVLVTYNSKSCNYNSYCIDPNARFSAGTMLLKNIQTSESYNKQKMYGISFSNVIPAERNCVDSLLNILGSDLYNYNKNYIGILPALINDVSMIGKDNNCYYLKTVVVDYTYAGALDKYNKFKNKLKKNFDIINNRKGF